MDYIYLREFLENYSLPTLIIAVTVAVLSLLYDKFLSSKLPNVIRNFIPFALSIVMYFAYDMIFVVKNFTFSAGTFSAGMLSGSLSVILTSSVYKLKSGKPLSTNATYIVIESLISDYVIADKLGIVVNTLSQITSSQDDNTQQNVLATLSENVCGEFNESELKALAVLIIKAVQAIRKN